MSGNTMGTCPSGGQWYPCTNQSPTFLGCCTSNPCNGVGCPSSDLRPAGMGTACGPDAQSIDASYWPYVNCPNGGQWWTFVSPSFQGCCDTDLSQGGCPSNQLHAAGFKYDSSAVYAATKLGTCSPSGWMDNVNAVATASSPTRITSATSQVSTASSTPSNPSNTPTTPPDATVTPATTVVTIPPAASATITPITSKNNTPAIAGGAAGGAALLIFLTLAFLWTYRRRQKRREAEAISAMTEYPEPAKQPTIPFQDENPSKRNTCEAYSPSRSIFGATKAPEHSPQLQPSPGPPAYSSGKDTPRPDIHEIQSAEVHEVGDGGAYAAELGGSGRRPVGLGVDSRRERVRSGISEMDENGGGRYQLGSGELLPGVREGGDGRGSGERGSYTSWQNLSPRSY